MAPLTDSDYCFAHDPARAADRAAARKQGGRNSSRADPVSLPLGEIDIRSMGGILGLLEEAVVTDTLRLANSNARNRTLIAALGLAQKLLEVGEHEARIAALEERLSQDDRPHLRGVG